MVVRHPHIHDGIGGSLLDINQIADHDKRTITRRYEPLRIEILSTGAIRPKSGKKFAPEIRQKEEPSIAFCSGPGPRGEQGIPRQIG